MWRTQREAPIPFQTQRKVSELQASGQRFVLPIAIACSKDWDAAKLVRVYPQDAILFMEGQTPRRIYMLSEGQAKLSVSSSEGKTFTLRIAEPGEVLGLMSALSGNPYELTAETLQPCQVASLRRDDFLRFLAQRPEAYQAAINQLCSDYQIASGHLKTVALSTSVSGKIAKFLLTFSLRGKQQEKDEYGFR